MPLYLILLLCSLLFPLALSFDRKVAFFRYWPLLIPSLLITGAFFIVFDIWFAKRAIWGFNAAYHSGIVLAGLPLEEWLFFIVIPYASIFIHYVLMAYFPAKVLSDRFTSRITITLILILALGILTHPGRSYTLVYLLLMIVVLVISSIMKDRLLNRFYISFLVILIPFIIINGILTGSFIEGEVVWYNPEEITGIRLGTIPVEDFAYGFSMILINLMLMNFFSKQAISNKDNKA
ncbi:MAG: lycopene cyclase domain-containing protein [Bacteroidales bacterium]|jgi:lycopene cyclase domain-containing protein|nr:lycopene cyclase domain-containing protein [Bacteroidales bacterium]